MKLLNKTNAAILSGAAYLSSSLPAFAQAVDLCPDGSLAAICNDAGNETAVIGNVITILVIVAVLIALVFLIWGGIKWITSGGDKAKVESARNTIIGAIIGLIVVFLAWFIISFVGQLFGVGDLKSFTIPNLLK